MKGPSFDTVTYFGETDHRNSGQRFGIRLRDRLSHVYICGKTGVGKSHLLRTMVTQDVLRMNGCAVLDAHGDLCTAIATDCQSHRSDMIVVELHDPASPWRYNPMRRQPFQDRARHAAGLVEAFKKQWPDDWGPRLEHLLRNVLLTLLEQEEGNLCDVPALLTDSGFRASAVAKVTDPIVRQFWSNEFDRYSFGFKSVIVAPLQNKIGALLTDSTSRRFLTQPGTELDLRAIMDRGQVLLINLDKGRIGEGPAAVVGSLIFSGLADAAMSRSETPESFRRPFFVFADEFQTWTTLSIANSLAELRKYRVGLTLANQHLGQLDPAIRDAVFGNAGTLIVFRVGAQDASFLSRELSPRFDASDLTNLERFHFVTRLLIDGVQSPPFSAVSLERTSVGREGAVNRPATSQKPD